MSKVKEFEKAVKEILSVRERLAKYENKQPDKKELDIKWRLTKRK